VHEVEVRAAPGEVDSALQTLDLGGSWMVRVLFAVRGLPREALRLDGLERLGFRILGRAPGEELVLGLIGRFWRWHERPVPFRASDFGGFSEPGYARAAWNFSIAPLGEGRTRLRTETRVACTDEGSRRAFRRYWRVVRPFSGLIRMEALRAIRGQAEAGARSVRPWPDRNSREA
jgi:hypothetical protein